MTAIYECQGDGDPHRVTLDPETGAPANLPTLYCRIHDQQMVVVD